MICLNEKFSTTKLLTKDEPEVFESLYLPANSNRKGEGGLRTKGYYKNSHDNKPLISIVTVVYNGAKFLEEAIESVLSQDYDNVEYIIIDGGSTDETVNIIKNYEDKIDYWVSEPDQGQSDAFNKAFSVCHGQLVSWLNGDDILLPGVLLEVSQKYSSNPSIHWFAGNILWVTEDKRILIARKGEEWNPSLVECGILNVYGPTSFFTLELFNKVGKMHSWMHYRMDTDLWWRFTKAKESFKRLDNYCWALRVHKDAKTTGAYFDESELSNEGHPSKLQMKKEDMYVKNEYLNT
ncbi:MAG: glycosyltransferase family 2 protein, partial [Sulfurimonas sp.]|nr:glycosyltransferase family 2 protein [Sulfurimonas sp.]